MSKVIYPGSFDPITKGHLEIIERCCQMFGEENVVVGVLINSEKSTVFTLDERVEMVKCETQHIPNIQIVGFSGLLIDFCKQNDIKMIIRGLRTSKDFEYEMKIANINQTQDTEIQTIALFSKPEHTFVSSTIVKEIATLGGDTSTFLSKYVEEKLNKRLKELKF